VGDQLQEIAAVDARDGDIIVYFDGEGLPKHAGVFQGGAIVSKGGLGHLWRHTVL
jgi:hypothetical protein